MMNNKEWFCMDCRAIRSLSLHGYCACCGSDAVDVAVREALSEKQMLETLEALWQSISKNAGCV